MMIEDGGNPFITLTKTNGPWLDADGRELRLISTDEIGRRSHEKKLIVLGELARLGAAGRLSADNVCLCAVCGGRLHWRIGDVPWDDWLWIICETSGCGGFCENGHADRKLPLLVVKVHSNPVEIDEPEWPAFDLWADRVAPEGTAPPSANPSPAE